MLTDYHVHLRPDPRENTAERFFTAANAERYRTVASERGIAELGVSEHVYRFRQVLSVWDHPFWRAYAVDMDDEWDVWRRGESPERIWQRYFDTVAEAARSGLYDVMAHPDLVKMWGRRRPRPEGDPRRYYEPAVEAFLDAGVAVEVSTAGLRKPAGELYPARAMLEMVVDAGCPIAISSDANVPDQLGFG